MFRQRNFGLLLVLICHCWLGISDVSRGQTANTTVQVRSREQLIDAVNDARPGTRILIAAGEYRGGLHFSELRGTEGSPIVLTALDENSPPHFVGGTSGIHLTSPRYVELRNMVLHGANINGLNIDDSAGGPTGHVVLHKLQVREIASKGNHDGIKLSGLNNFSVEECSVESWGEGGSGIDMVGCHNGEIKGCHFQFRSDISANGVQAKGGSANISVRRCRFKNAGGRAINIGGSTGRAYFRPPQADYEAKNIVVEDCTFIGSAAPIAFVGVDGATVRYNTIYRPARWVIRILQESQGAEFIPCRNGVFSNNIVAFRSDELRTAVNIGEGTAPETFRFEKNHWCCIDNPQRSDRLDLPTAETNPSYAAPPMFRDVPAGDFRLHEQSPVIDAGVREYRADGG